MAAFVPEWRRRRDYERDGWTSVYSTHNIVEEEMMIERIRMQEEMMRYPQYQSQIRPQPLDMTPWDRDERRLESEKKIKELKDKAEEIVKKSEKEIKLKNLIAYYYRKR